MDNFLTREYGGRKKWLKVNENQILAGHKVILFTDDKYNPVDFYMTAGTVYSVGEIKDINRPFTKYNDFQIDASKVRNVVNVANTTHRIPYLVAFFSDCFCVWDLSKVDFESRCKIRKCTANTAGRYTKGQIDKEETYFNKEEAIYIKQYD